MNPLTRYRYEKRIEELKRRIENLEPYRSVAIDIFNAAVDNVAKDTAISKAWILYQFRQMLK